ncbi:MAG: hypothetical protein M3680_31575, partial [Myxococcota bacterium]|nr:hypothetical protein [Myxococcota bacterium]
SAPAAPPPPPAIARGVLRIEGQSTMCRDIITVHPDGGAAVLCSFGREDGCGIRQLGPDGEERGRSELAPGTCAQWVPHARGGGYLITHADGYRALVVTALDAAGKRGATTRLTSTSGVYASDAHVAADGGLFAALQFHGDLAYRGKRLGKSSYGVPAIVRFPAGLDRLAWSRLFDKRRTQIAALLPAAQGDGIDAVLDTRGPLVPGAPMHPKENPEDGSIYGGDTYGWRAERVAFDRRGKPGGRQELNVGPHRSVMAAAMVDGSLATLGSDPASWKRSILTLLRGAGGGEREQKVIAQAATGRFAVANGRTWLIDRDWTEVGGKGVTTWHAHEVGGARRKLALPELWGTQPVSWSTLAVHEDHVVALGTTADPTTGTPVSITALATLAATAPALVLQPLALVDRLALAPGCRGVRSKLDDQVARVQQADGELAACGVPAQARAELTTYPEGGIARFAIKDLGADAVACARRVVEPAFACPSSGSVSFTLRR